MRCSVNMLQEGNVLASDVVDSHGWLLLKKDSILGPSSINLIKNRDVLAVNIVNPSISLEEIVKTPPPAYEISKEIIEGSINEKSAFKEQYVHGIEAIRNMDVETTSDIAKDICIKMFEVPDLQEELGLLREGYDSVLSHSMNVAMLTAALIVWQGNVTNEMCYDAVTGAMLHDIGKLYVSRDILEKPGKLTSDEYEVIKQHSELGYLKLRSTNNVSEKIALMAYQHHENEDGSGYPNHLKGSEILLESRIIHLADVYEAMTAKRCYKEPILTGDVIEHIMAKYGSMFNTEITDEFLKIIPAYHKGDVVMLSNYQIAEVLQANTLNSLRPKIKITQSGKELNLFTDRSTMNTTITELIHRRE